MYCPLSLTTTRTHIIEDIVGNCMKAIILWVGLYDDQHGMNTYQSTESQEIKDDRWNICIYIPPQCKVKEKKIPVQISED